MNANLKILIVDRPFASPTIREMLGKSKEATIIREVSAYSDALYLLKQMAFDMLIFDASLPERLRHSLMKYLRTRYPCIKVIPFHKDQRALAQKTQSQDPN
jgi:DNA-binding NarL/FixJ family response regulator